MVMTCINCFSKMLQLVSLQESDACTMADRFLNMVVSQYKLPRHIISDCDPRFHSNFWDKLMPSLNIILTFSMALQPQTDGMAEATKHTME